MNSRTLAAIRFFWLLANCEVLARSLASIPPLLRRDGCETRADYLGCPGHQLKPNFPGAPPADNGCGPQTSNSLGGLFNKILDQPWASPCCQDHDRCYGDCDMEWSPCNTNFFNCLQDSCSQQAPSFQSLCSVLADIYTAAVSTSFGCHFFLSSTSSSCHCS